MGNKPSKQILGILKKQGNPLVPLAMEISSSIHCKWTTDLTAEKHFPKLVLF